MIGSVRGGKLFENKNEVLIVKMYFKIDYFMNKNIRAVMMIAAIALIAGVNVFNSQRAIAMSDIALANVEALADDETAGDIHCPFGGYGCVIIYSNGAAETFWGKSPNEH